jgi:Flp pilus assembly pilin Flp
MKELMKRLARDEVGLELSEYALMMALLVVGLIAVLVSLRGAIANTFTVLTNTIGSNS